MEQRQKFFVLACKAELTGEQARVLMRFLSYERSGEIHIRQNTIAEDLDMPESNVSRSIKALIDAGLIYKSVAKGPHNIPVFKVVEMNQTSQITPVVEPEAAWNALYDAHVLFVKELYTVHSSLAVFRIVGLNTRKLKGPGAEFVRFSSLLSQRAIVTGIESLFERKDNGAGLCSIRGILSLAENVDIRNPESAKRFASKYHVKPSADWRGDIDKVLEKQRPIVAACTRLTSRVRNQRVAHLAQSSADTNAHFLPGLDACEQVIEFAYDFYVFIATGFLNSADGAELHDKVGQSLYQLMKQRFGIEDALYDFPDSSDRD